jgi:hypothetical protein
VIRDAFPDAQIRTCVAALARGPNAGAISAVAYVTPSSASQYRPCVHGVSRRDAVVNVQCDYVEA